MCAAIYLSFLAIGIEVPWFAALAILGINVVALMFPTAPANIGVTQLSYSIVLRSYGIDPSTAFAASMLNWVIGNVIIIVFGMYFRLLVAHH